MADVLVRCVSSRMIGDCCYVAGEQYVLTTDRASRYRDYFTVIGPAVSDAAGSEQEKMEPPPPNKRRGAPQNKGQV